MSRDLLLSFLRKGKTGSEILMILDSITGSDETIESDDTLGTLEEIDALLALIEFHDDWDEVSEIVGVNVAQLYDKVSALVTY